MPLRIVAVVLLAGVAGCAGDGGSAGAERQVRGTVREFVRSLLARDYQRACAMVTEEVRADWRAFARRNPKLFSTKSCPAFAADFYRGARGNIERDFAKLDRATVRVDGNTATLQAHPSDRRRGQDGTTKLQRLNGRWLLGD